MKETERTVVEAASSRQDIDASIARLREALEIGRGCLEETQIVRAEQDVDKIVRRLDAAKDLTVAVLAGGTGSGKSSLFNAITGLQFADVGDIRPMTKEAAACVWNADASELLDLLEVRRQRRIAYDSILVDADRSLDGLVLLDLPDHDSIALHHSAAVNAMLPMADLVIWVLDPQKYADHLIHDIYLSQMRRRRGSMIVVLNQMDIVVPTRVDELVADVKSKLAEDGLADIPVYAVSAWEETGLAAVREELRRAVASDTTALEMAHAELDAIRTRLADGVGAQQDTDLTEAVEEATSRIEAAVGTPSVVESLRHAGSSLKAVAIVRPEKPASSMSTAIRDAWMSQARVGLPEKWAAELDRKVATPDRLRRDAGRALEELKIPAVATQLSRVLFGVGVLVGILGLVQLVAGWPLTSFALRIGVAVACVAFAIVSWPAAMRMQKVVAAAEADAFSAHSHEILGAVVKADLLGPTQEVLARHRAVREELLAVLEV